MTSSAPCGKPKSLGSGGSMVANLKLPTPMLQRNCGWLGSQKKQIRASQITRNSPTLQNLRVFTKDRVGLKKGQREIIQNRLSKSAKFKYKTSATTAKNEF